MLSITKLCKSYHSAGSATVVLKNLDLDISAGVSVALLGDSGSGKSTLLHLIAGLERPDGGEIDFCGTAVHSESESNLAALRRHQISLVFQQFHLISTLNIHDNIRFQAALCQRFDDDYETLLIDKLGLAEQLNKLPFQLSRGQQQRVAIARALLHKPKLVLADEPTGNLDEGSSLEVMQIFRDLVKHSGSSLLMVTHSQEMAAFMERQVYLKNGQLSDLDAQS